MGIGRIATDRFEVPTPSIVVVGEMVAGQVQGGQAMWRGCVQLVATGGKEERQKLADLWWDERVGVF